MVKSPSWRREPFASMFPEKSMVALQDVSDLDPYSKKIPAGT
jgi:hypothetical protein